MGNKSAFFVIMSVMLSAGAGAQTKWNLRSIVEYAMANNLIAKQLDIQAKSAALSYEQSKLSRYPSFNFNGNYGMSSGSSQDPTTFSRNTQTYYSSGYQLQTSVDIFNFYSKRNNILANEFELKAAAANSEKFRNDLALTAANSYLNILLAMEQKKIATVQLQQSQAQLADTRKRVNAGALPELNATQLEAQVAFDSTNLVSAEGNIAQAILALKTNLSIAASEPFEVEALDVEQIPLEPIADLQPELVYASALKNLPQQKYNALKLVAAAHATKSAKGAMLPTFSGYGGIGTNTSSAYRTVKGFSTITGPNVKSGSVTVNGVEYDVMSPTSYTNVNYVKPGYFTQMADNFRQSLGLSVSVPIFAGGSLKTNYLRSKLNTENLLLHQQNDDLTLQQDIYKAYNAALVALQKANASERVVAANTKALEFAQKRYNIGMLGTFELITQQNNLLNAKLQHALNKYDYVFKMKVLEFYKGTGLKL